MGQMTSLEAVAAYLKIDESMADKYALISSIIDAVTRTFIEKSGHPLWIEERTEFFDTGISMLKLKAWPVLEGDDAPVVYYDPALREYADDTIIDSYRLDADRGIIYLHYPVKALRWDAYKVIYTGGITEEASEEGEEIYTLRPDLGLAAFYQTVYVWNSLKWVGSGDVSIKDVRISIPTKLELCTPFIEAIKSCKRPV